MQPPQQPYPQQPYPQQPYPQQPYPPHAAYGRPPKKKMGCGVMIAIALAVAVPVLGILASIAIPAFTKYIRRSKTSEARIELAKLFDSMSSYYSEHGRCPGGAEGSAGLTPPETLDCNDGAEGRCQPGGTGPAGYDSSAWDDNETWAALGFAMVDSHYFHYDVEWTQDESGGCQFTVQAYGDLDDDGVFSTFERAGVADVNGIEARAGLHIDNEVE